ncbi:MAG: type I DNA topoisomerase, partial [bacterium]
MKKAMIIVESRAKTQSIGKIVGDDYVVQHCFGHVYDLPETDLGVDVTKDFKPRYVPVKGKQKLINALKKEAENVEEIILATDPDREGESIAWHLSKLFKGKKISRMSFNEITSKAVKEALENLTDIDERLVNAQQARRVLDRLVGYKLSPLLWRRVKEGLSAGRVQSVALRLIVDREKEVEKFVPEEYWKLTATFSRKDEASDTFKSLLIKLDNEELKLGNDDKKIKVGSEKEAEDLRKKLLKHSYHVEKITKKIEKRNPYPPYITSTLQQDASSRINFSPSRTMTIAQQLYEGIELGPEGTAGLITYMRTDSVRVSDEALSEARSFILEKFGADYLPQKAMRYKKKGTAQDAHEAIRPTGVAREPSSVSKYLNPEQLKLYTLIWNRFVASQMKPAEEEVVRADIANGSALFRAKGVTILFDGFRLIYKPQLENDDEKNEKENGNEQLPPLKEKDLLKLEQLDPSQHFTKPPPRYSEASIVRKLENKGIGRPSTYVPTIDTIKKRGYVKMEKRIFHPTQWGFIVTELLSENFKDIMDYDFTARMESNLDSIEEGKKDWVEVVRNFYETFSKELETAVKTMRYEKKLDVACEKCGGQMVLRSGKFGLFYA